MTASNYQPDNLCAVIDRNGLQISGSTEDVMKQEDLAARWSTFGWHVLTIDGDCIAAIDEAFTKAKEIKGKPTMIIAGTTKGYGSSMMEGNSGTAPGGRRPHGKRLPHAAAK